MKPIYFRPERRLFGCYHEPEFSKWRESAALLCPPCGHEYLRTHRAIRQLAMRLCGVGFPVLRFDYFGCGDSDGDDEDGAVAQWIDDISSAARELQARSSVDHVAFVGCRLGANLCLLNGGSQVLVAWDPIVNGRAYLTQLEQLHRTTSRAMRATRSDRPSPDAGAEFLGFIYSASLLSDLSRIDLRTLNKGIVRDLLLVTSSPNGESREVDTVLQSVGRHQETLLVTGSRPWFAGDSEPVVPHRTIADIATWLSRTCP